MDTIREIEKLRAQFEKLIRGRKGADDIRDALTRLEWAHMRWGAELHEKATDRAQARRLN